MGATLVPGRILGTKGPALQWGCGAKTSPSALVSEPLLLGSTRRAQGELCGMSPGLGAW